MWHTINFQLLFNFSAPENSYKALESVSEDFPSYSSLKHVGSVQNSRVLDKFYDS